MDQVTAAKFGLQKGKASLPGHLPVHCIGVTHPPEIKIRQPVIIRQLFAGDTTQVSVGAAVGSQSGAHVHGIAAHTIDKRCPGRAKLVQYQAA